jgi:hypothetical protein
MKLTHREIIMYEKINQSVKITLKNVLEITVYVAIPDMHISPFLTFKDRFPFDGEC